MPILRLLGAYKGLKYVFVNNVVKFLVSLLGAYEGLKLAFKGDRI